MINLLYQTYLIVLPIILGYIIWLLKEQKKKQINDAKARDERIQEDASLNFFTLTFRALGRNHIASTPAAGLRDALF